jgi:RimJ/RimL family protein N-acetyltransferase
MKEAGGDRSGEVEFSSMTTVDVAQAMEIVRLRTAAWGGDPDERVVAEEAKALRQEVTGSDPGAYGLFVARVQGALVGFVKAQQDAENPSVWWWLGLVVHPGYRRCGIARGLLERCAAYAGEHGATTLRSDTHLDNAASIAVHERLGFRNDGVFESPYDGDKKVAFTFALARDHGSTSKVT